MEREQRLGINISSFYEWRTTFKKRTGKILVRNTAILELKLLSLVMGEAVRLGLLLRLEWMLADISQTALHPVRAMQRQGLRQVFGKKQIE